MKLHEDWDVEAYSLGFITSSNYVVRAMFARGNAVKLDRL